MFLRLPLAELLLAQFQETARHRGWGMLAAAVMRGHVHRVVGVLGDPEPDVMLRDFKAYGSRVLNRRFSRPGSGTWWTEGGSKRVKRTEEAVAAAVRYVARQEKGFSGLGGCEVGVSVAGGERLAGLRGLCRGLASPALPLVCFLKFLVGPIDGLPNSP